MRAGGGYAIRAQDRGSRREQGADLETVTRTASQVIENVVSIGMSLDTCTVPGSRLRKIAFRRKPSWASGSMARRVLNQVDFGGARHAIER